MSNVHARQHIFINQNLATGVSWTQFINIEFIPDEMIVRQILYDNGHAINGAFVINTNLVKDGILGIACDGFGTTPQQVFTMKKQIKGQYQFSLTTINGIPYTGNASQFTVSLEFIKYI